MRKSIQADEQGGIVDRRYTPAQARGNAAESLAKAFLAQQGCRTIARQFRCKAGEIDLICLCSASVVFVEVRMRGSARYGSAAESITATKRQRLVRAAQWWLAGPGQEHAHRACRFDVVVFDQLSPEGLHWIPAAFDAG